MKIKNYIKNTKGASSVEFISSLFIFVMVMSFVFDLIFIGYKQFAVSIESNKLIRILNTQSGSMTSVPANFPGGSSNYITVSKLSKMVDDKMDNLGINDYTFKITAEDPTAPGGERYIYLPNSNSQGIKTDYRGYISIEIKYKYKFNIWSQFIPGNLEGNATVSRSGFAEYKFDYNIWDGEK